MAGKSDMSSMVNERTGKGSSLPSKTPRCHYDMELGKQSTRGTEPVKKTGK